jgi:hypothetical protein
MPLDPKTFLRLKEEVEEERRQADQAQGSLNQIAARLKETFNCPDLQAAEKLDKKLEKEEEKLEREYQKAEQAFRSKRKEKIRA